MSQPVCVIAGAGPGNGIAFARKFAAEGYAVALLARDGDRLKELAADIDGGQTFACDVTDPNTVATAFDHIRERMGPVDILCYNAGSGHWGDIDNTTVETMEDAWRVNVAGLLTCAKQVLGDMRAAGGGNIVVTGATASLRGGANFTSFASAKAAQHSLAQSMARALGKEGIHVSIVIVDGVVDIPKTREMLPDKPDEFFMRPDDIAESVYHLTRQAPSAWTFQLDLRPSSENW